MVGDSIYISFIYEIYQKQMSISFDNPYTNISRDFPQMIVFPYQILTFVGITIFILAMFEILPLMKKDFKSWCNKLKKEKFFKKSIEDGKEFKNDIIDSLDRFNVGYKETVKSTTEHILKKVFADKKCKKCSELDICECSKTEKCPKEL